MIDLDELERLWQAATPGPRKLYHGGNEAWPWRALPDENAESYVAQHNAWPAILAELRAGRVLAEAAERVLNPMLVIDPLSPGMVKHHRGEVGQLEDRSKLRLALAIYSPKFPDTSCSQCGQGFGAGDHGYSHCEDHAGKRGTP